MRKFVSPAMMILLVLGLGLSGCATEKYVQEQVAASQKVTDAKELQHKIGTSSSELEMLIEIVSNLKIDDATQRTTIIDAISPVFGTGFATVACMALHFATFMAKVVVMIWLQMQLRWTLPRFRYDQVMDLCWKIMLPLSIANILVTGLVMLIAGGR